MKKTKRIFRHFLAILNVIACGVPLITLGIVTLQDVLPKYFTSLGMQHHGDGSSTFEDDIDSLTTSNQFNDVNENMLLTLDKLDYLKYGGQSTKIVKKTLQTNEVNSISDLVVGNVYQVDYYMEHSGTTLIYIGTLDNFDFSINYNKNILNLFGYEPSEIFIELPINSLSDTSLLRYRIPSTNALIFFEYTYPFRISEDYHVQIPFIYLGGLSSNYQYISYIKTADLSLVPSIYDEVESDIVGYVGWKAAFDGENYSTIVSEGTDTHLVLNIDFISLFQTSEIVNYNNNVAIYLFINFYFNYLLNVLLLLFLPEFILLFIDFIKQLLYKFTDVKGDS